MTDTQLEELLQKHDSVYSGPMLPKDILSAMKESMRIESIGFANWIVERKDIIPDPQAAEHWYIANKDGIYNLPTDQLYNEYLKNV